MADRQDAGAIGGKPVENAQGQDGLSPQVLTIKESLEKYLRPPMNEAGLSERHRNNIIAYGVKACAEQFEKGLDRVLFAGVHKVKNLVVIETNLKYSSIMYDAVAASRVDAKESLVTAELACQQVHGGHEGQSQVQAQTEVDQQKSGPSR